MAVDIDKVKKLREATGISVLKCRKALEESGGDIEAAKRLLISQGAAVAEAKKGREVSNGLIHAYIHTDARLGVLLELRCETDFVARSQEFKELAKELSLQIASMDPKDADELLKQDYIKDSSKTVNDLVVEAISKLGENIQVGRFVRYQL